MTQEKKEKGITTYQQLELGFGELNDQIELYLVDQGNEEKEIKKMFK